MGDVLVRDLSSGLMVGLDSVGGKDPFLRRISSMPDTCTKLTAVYVLLMLQISFSFLRFPICEKWKVMANKEEKLISTYLQQPFARVLCQYLLCALVSYWVG